MLSLRSAIMTAALMVAFATGWLARTSAQQKAPAPLITYFSHDKLDATFAHALASTGSEDLFARKDRQGRTWAIHANSRGKADEGTLHSHEDWTGVVVIMSGAATLMEGGKSQRVSRGDVAIIPPNAPHMYRNIEEPFQYLVIQTP